MHKLITVVIDEEGNSSIDLSGFAGHGCAHVLKDFQGDDKVRTERKKPEYYQEARQAGEDHRQRRH